MFRVSFMLGVSALCLASGVSTITPAHAHQQQDGAVQYPRESASNLAVRVCTMAETYYGYEEAGERIEDVILNHLGIDRSTPYYRGLILNFWNENSADLICRDPSSKKPNARTPQHFMKRVVDMNLDYQIFGNFLLSDAENFPIDVNAVEIINGRRETLLDIIDAIIATPEVQDNYRMSHIRRLRRQLVTRYGALNARAIPDGQ